jgi:predicted MPP superfamily phosphohydrolase
VNLAVLGASVLLAGVGFAEARRRPRVRRVDIPIEGLPEAWAGFSIAQLTDIHVGPTIKRDFLERVVEATNALGADVIAITGDLVDGSVRELAEHVAPLRQLVADKGVYFVTGNHEYYAGAEPWIAHVRSLGLDVLMNEHRALVLAGVTDFNAGGILPHHACDPAAALRGAPDGVRLMLAHQPRTALLLDGLDVDLVLAGHTHGGQFWPWHLFVKLQQPVVEGLDRLHGRLIYTSRGTGYWGPPNRLGAPSEISLLRLIPA